MQSQGQEIIEEDPDQGQDQDLVVAGQVIIIDLMKEGLIIEDQIVDQGMIIQIIGLMIMIEDQIIGQEDLMNIIIQDQEMTTVQVDLEGLAGTADQDQILEEDKRDGAIFVVEYQKNNQHLRVLKMIDLHISLVQDLFFYSHK